LIVATQISGIIQTIIANIMLDHGSIHWAAGFLAICVGVGALITLPLKIRLRRLEQEQISKAEREEEMKAAVEAAISAAPSIEMV
jgi:hypothetical protein